MAKKKQTNRQKAKTLAAKGVSAQKIQQRTGVSKQAAQKFTQKAAAPTPPPTQATPTSFQVTPQTQTTGFSFTPAEKASGNIFGTDIGNGLTAYTQGAPIKDPSVLRQQIGLSATPEAAPAATGGGGGKQKQKKDISDKGLKAQLKIYGADNKIGGKEYKKLTAQGYTPEQITKRLDVLNQNKGLKIGLGSNVLNKIGKEIAADPFSAISIPGAGNVTARGFGEGKLGQAIKQLAGGTEAPGQRTSPAPAPNQLLKPEPGTVGAGGIQPGQVLRAGGQVGTRQPTRAERQLANQGAIAAAPNVTQPATDTAGGGGMTAPDTAGGDFGYITNNQKLDHQAGAICYFYDLGNSAKYSKTTSESTWFDNSSNASGFAYGVGVLHVAETHNAIRFSQTGGMTGSIALYGLKENLF